jgi:hypothetical protein
MWVKFLADFDFSPTARGGNVTIAYRAGSVENVTRECFDLAKAAKAVEAVKPPKRNISQ